MKLYRVALRHSDGMSHGSQFFSNKRDAENAVKAWVTGSDPPGGADIDEVNVEPTKTGIIAALNQYGGHADNG